MGLDLKLFQIRPSVKAYLSVSENSFLVQLLQKTSTRRQLGCKFDTILTKNLSGWTEKHTTHTLPSLIWR